MMYRTATVDDAATLAALRWQFRLEELQIDDLDQRDVFVRDCAAWFAAEMAAGSTVVWVAVDADAIVAHICIRVVRKIPAPREFEQYVGYVTNVYTLPAYRNRGIGTTLLEHVKLWAHQQPFDVLFLWPSDRSRPFYQRAGFKHHNDIHEYSIHTDEI